MSSEVREYLCVMREINRHLEESDCHHPIKFIISQALNKKAGAYEAPADDAATKAEDKSGHGYTE